MVLKFFLILKLFYSKIHGLWLFSLHWPKANSVYKLHCLWLCGCVCATALQFCSKGYIRCGFIASRGVNMYTVFTNMVKKVGKAGDRWHMIGDMWQVNIKKDCICATIRSRLEVEFLLPPFFSLIKSFFCFTKKNSNLI